MVTPADAASPDRSQPDHTFDFCGGQLAIDFTNTVGSRDDGPVDRLNTFGDLVAWAEARGVIARADGSALRRDAVASPDRARRVLRDARTLREALYGVFRAIADDRRPRPADLERVNRAVAATYGASALAPTPGGRFVLETAASAPLARLIHPVVRAAVELLTSDDATRIGRCADETCGWVFLDTTRSHTRRWCDMKACGNRNKVRRFRER